jgi:O-succinylhomoserine sulfhydrylase
LRVAAHVQNAAKIADFLAGAKPVARVLYPGHKSHPQYKLAKRQMKGGGPLVAFDLAGGKNAAFAFMDALRLVKISNNLGDAKSLICHPATTTHQRLPADEKARLRIGPGSLRLSVGIEDPQDLLADLARGLAAAAKTKRR